MELGDGGKGVGKALRAQIQQRLHEHVDLERIEGRLDHIVLGSLARVRQILQLVQHVLRGALLPNGHHQLVGGRRSRQGCWKIEREKKTAHIISPQHSKRERN